MCAYRAATLLASALVTSGCAAWRERAAPEPAGVVEIIEDKVPIDWKSVATAEDQERLSRIDEAWSAGLAGARRFQRQIADEGSLLDPKAALPRGAPTPGPYLCRTLRLGGRPAFVAFKPFYCYVEAEGELLTMVKQTGSLRPAGRLWPDSDSRMVFLGAAGAGLKPAPPYAADPERDTAGYMERVDAFRWRLVVPWPRNGAALEIYELVPSVPQSAPM
jgi:hypothetical protein